MKILLDHCVPKPLGREFTTHYVRTAAQMGWEDLRNGVLLMEAAREFDVFLTVDKNIRNEQNLQALPLPIIVLDAPRNTAAVLCPFAPFIESALRRIRRGQMLMIDSTGNVTEISPGR